MRAWGCNSPGLLDPIQRRASLRFVSPHDGNFAAAEVFVLAVYRNAYSVNIYSRRNAAGLPHHCLAGLGLTNMRDALAVHIVDLDLHFIGIGFLQSKCHLVLGWIGVGEYFAPKGVDYIGSAGYGWGCS